MLPPPISSAAFHRRASSSLLPAAPSPHPSSSSSSTSTSSGRLKLRLSLEREQLVAGQTVRGTLEVDCKIRKGGVVGLGEVFVELTALEELRSRTHTSTRRLLTLRTDFQGSSRPPSAAVVPGSTPLQSNFYPALPGRTRFAFSFHLPPTLPSSFTLGGNAVTRFELRAVAASLIDGNVDLHSETAAVKVVERWEDWRKGPWAVEGGVEKKAAGQLALGGDGKVEVTASVGKRGEWVERPPRLFWRREVEDGVEGKDTIRVEVKVRNASKRHVTGLKLSLLRRLRLLAPTSDEAPLVTSSIHTERFHGVGYDVAANSERDLQVQMKVPDDQEAHSVRKGTLFEIDTFVRVEVDCGFLAKNLVVDLPVWIAQPHSLPPSAHRFALEEARRLALPTSPNSYHPPAPPAQTPSPHLPAPVSAGVPYNRPSSPVDSTVGFPMPHSPSSSFGFDQSRSPATYWSYPSSNPNSPLAHSFSQQEIAQPGQLPLPGMVSPPLAQGAFAPPPSTNQGMARSPSPSMYGGFAASPVSMTTSASSPAFGKQEQCQHFAPLPLSHTPLPGQQSQQQHYQHPSHYAPPPPPPSLSQVYHHHPQQHVVAFNPSAPDLTPSRFMNGFLQHHQPSHIPGAAVSAEVAAQAGVAVPAPISPPRPCPSPAPSSVVPTARPAAEILPHLPPHEQQALDRVLHSPVAAYSASERAHQHPRTASAVDYSPDRSASHERERDLAVVNPPSPPRTCPSPVPSLRPASRAAATPPPPSPSSHFSSRRSPSPSPVLSPQQLPLAPPAAAELLETIGEDGESQAGTARSAMLGRGVKELLAEEGREHAAQQERERQQQEREREKEVKAERRRSTAEELERWVEKEDEEREEERRRSGASLPSPQLGGSSSGGGGRPLPLPPLPPSSSVSPSPAKPSRKDVFPSLPSPNTVKSPSPALTLSARDPSALSALERRLLARSPSPSKAPSSPAADAPPSPSPALPFSSPPLIPFSSPLLPSSATLSAPASTGTSALRQRSISRASRMTEDEELRERVREAEERPGEVVRRMGGGWGRRKEVETKQKQEKEEEKKEEVEVEKVEQKEEKKSEEPEKVVDVPAAASPPKTRPVFSSFSSPASAPCAAPSTKRHTLPALPTPPPPTEPTEAPFVPPARVSPSLSGLSAGTSPVAAIIKRNPSPLSSSSPFGAAAVKTSSTATPAARPNPWSAAASNISPPRTLPSRLSSLPPPPSSTSLNPSSPTSPVDPSSGRKIVDHGELKELKQDAVERISGWLKEGGAAEGTGRTGSVTVMRGGEGGEDVVGGTRAAEEKSRKRRTIEFGRLAPAPPSSAVGSTATQSSRWSTNISSLSSHGPASSRPPFSQGHKHTLSVPVASPSFSSRSLSPEPTVAQLLAAETRLALKQARIGSPPPWTGGAHPNAAGASPVVAGKERFLAALQRDEEGANGGGGGGEVYRHSARGGKGGKVTSVIGVWAERVEEADRDGTASPPLPPSSPPPSTSSCSPATRHRKATKSMSFLPSSMTSPSLSTTSFAAPSPLSTSTSAATNTSSSSPAARLITRSPASASLSANGSSASSGGRSSPAKPFLNTALDKGASSPLSTPALRVPSGKTLSTSESAPALAGKSTTGGGGGGNVRALLERYKKQVGA